MYDVCVYDCFYIVEATNENEAKMIACDIYNKEFGLIAYIDDNEVVCYPHVSLAKCWDDDAIF